MKNYWFCLELNTGAWDGFYKHEKDACDVATELSKKWRNSRWIVAKQFHEFGNEKRIYSGSHHKEKRAADLLDSLFLNTYETE